VPTTVLDTTTLWSCDSFFRQTYSDLRSSLCMARVFSELLAADTTLTFIVPTPRDYPDRPEEILERVGHSPVLFKALLQSGLLTRPMSAWGAQAPEVGSPELLRRFDRFKQACIFDAESVRAFALLHTHESVAEGWFQRVAMGHTGGYQFPDPNEQSLGLPPHLREFLAKSEGHGEMKYLAEHIGGCTPWQLRLTFSILNRGADYDVSVRQVGGGSAQFLTHPQRYLFREPSGPESDGALGSECVLNARTLLGRYYVALHPFYPEYLGDVSTLKKAVDALRSKVPMLEERLRHLLYCDVAQENLAHLIVSGIGIDNRRHTAILEYVGELRSALVESFGVPETRARQSVKRAMGIGLSLLTLEFLLAFLATQNPAFVGALVAVLAYYRSGFAEWKGWVFGRPLDEVLIRTRIRKLEATALFGCPSLVCNTCGSLLGQSDCRVCGTQVGLTNSDHMETLAAIRKWVLQRLLPA